MGQGTNAKFSSIAEIINIAQSDIMVEVEQIGEFHAKIPAMAAAGTLPDVVRSWEAMALDLGRNGQFIDIQPMVDGCQVWIGCGTVGQETNRLAAQIIKVRLSRF